jgi:undecaprenyl diphosphate synthase
MTAPSAALPRHIAIIMDGNGRWAKKRFLPRHAGHRAGVDAVRRTVSRCGELGVEVLTLFAFSSENWRRPSQEVNLLMQLFMNALKREMQALHRNQVRLHIIGDRTAFNPELQALIADAEHLTQDNQGLRLVIAANYGGHWDIAQAVRQLAQQVATGELDSQAIDNRHIAAHLSLAGLPNPDLFIRTGGEQRISNFLLWQLAYTELFFSEVLWPDFNQAELERAITAFASRQRRFGQTGEQVEGNA